MNRKYYFYTVATHNVKNNQALFINSTLNKFKNEDSFSFVLSVYFGLGFIVSQ